MSETHDQAMKYVYHQVLQRLLGHLSVVQKTSLQLLMQRLIVAAGGIECIGGLRIMMAYSGGKDSSHALAFLRAAQLSIAARAPDTFQLRVATLRHAGMTPAVLGNIQRTYDALFANDDPRVAVLMVDDRKVMPFDAKARLSLAASEANRQDVLMAGHLTAGEARPTFCNRCYVNLADFYRQVSAWDGGVDIIIDSERPGEQARYLAWGRRVLRGAGLLSNDDRRHQGQLLAQLGELGGAYYRQLHGDEHWAAASLAQPWGEPCVISVHDLVHTQEPTQSTLLSEFLGFRFDDLAFAFNESDCANPLLMAHMQGLRAQFQEGRDYREGVEHFLRAAVSMMRRKHTCEALIEKALAAYRSDSDLKQQRQLASDFAQQAYGLSEAQLVCLLFAPFVNEGQALESFLRCCHPGMLVALPYLHKALQGHGAPEPVSQWLVDIGGLPTEALQRLYRMRRVGDVDRSSLIARLRDADPYQVPQRNDALFERASGRR